MRRVGGIERHDLWAERRTATGNRRSRDRVVQVRHFKFVDVPALESDVPIIVELVIVRAAKPLQIIVAPYAVVYRVSDQIDIVPPTVAAPAQASTARWLRPRIPRHRGSCIQRVWIGIGHSRADVP